MPSKLVQALANISREQLQSFAVRLDGWANDVTGFGTTRDKTTYGRFLARSCLSDQQLSDLYHFNDMAARMVDVVPAEMFREGFVVDLGEPDLSQTANDKLADLDARQAFVEASRWGRLFGGAAIIIGCDDGRPAELPLVPERAKDVDWLYVVDRRYLWPLTYYQSGKKFGRPEMYMVSPSSGAVRTAPRVVHESRLILFGGAPTAETERQQNASWDYSVLQRPHDVLRQFDTGWTAVENLLTDANQAVYKMSGLADAIAAGRTEYLQQRATIADMGRSVVRAMVIDAGDEGGSKPEEFSRHSVSFADIPATLDKFMLRLSAAVQIPVTILMGQSPAGMNATGESDFRWFYDRIRAEQNNHVAPKIRRLVDVWLRTKAGPRLTEEQTPQITFPPLWTETPAADAARKKAIAETDNIYVTAGVYTPEEVALVRSAPGGFDVDITLTDEGKAARETMLGAELDKIEKSAEGESGDATGIEITPSDVAKVVTVNEARAAQGLGPLTLPDGSPDPDGLLTVYAYSAKSEASGTLTGESEAREETGAQPPTPAFP